MNRASFIRRRLSIKLWLILLAISFPLVAGCGPKIPKCYPVSGKVSWKGGKSFKAGTITFLHKAEPEIIAIGEIGADGSFTVSTKMFGQSKEGAPEGEYTVMVEDPAKNVAPDGQMQIKPIVAMNPSYKVEAKESNDFKIEVVQ